MLVLVCNLTRLGEDDAVRLAKLPNPPVLVHGAHREVILVACGEVGQRAGHRQRQSLHVSHLATGRTTVRTVSGFQSPMRWVRS